MKASRARTLKVGVFVVVGIVLATLAVFTISESRRVWDRKVIFNASYDDVVGLKPGSVVRMGGLDVGSVEAVEHGADPNDPRVYVKMAVARSEAVRIRKGTLATIEGKGLLGDKMVQLTPDEHLSDKIRKEGQNPAEPIPEGGWITTAPPGDPFGDAQRAAQSAKVALDNIQKATESIADESFRQDLQGSVRSLHEVLDGIAHKDGVMHRLVFDVEEGKRFDRIVQNMEAMSGNLAKISDDARELSAQVKKGPGLAHAVLYDEALARGLSGTLVELHATLEAVRTKNGFAHAVVYGDDQTQRVMGNVQAVSEDLREIVANMKAGRGTLGGLLVDPTIYEDVKSLVGNVERNQVLRALVRYSIRQSEDRPRATVRTTSERTEAPKAPPPAKATEGEP